MRGIEPVDVLLLGRLPPACTEALGARFTTHRPPDGAPAEAAARLAASSLGARIRAVATNASTGCPAELMDALPRLEIVAAFGIGLDGIDLDACRARGIRVTATPHVLDDAVAELAIGLMIALARRIPAAHAHVRSGAWADGRTFGLTRELSGGTLAILGLGRIGKEIARRAEALRMHIVYHGRHRQADVPHPYFADVVSMARAADVLVCAVPGGAATAGLVGPAVLDALGPEGLLVNVGRGSTVDEEALVAALRTGRLGGAALDVFATEPVVPEALRRLDNVVLSPHLGSATHKTRTAMADLVVANLLAHFEGRPLPTRVA